MPELTSYTEHQTLEYLMLNQEGKKEVADVFIDNDQSYRPKEILKSSHYRTKLKS